MRRNGCARRGSASAARAFACIRAGLIPHPRGTPITSASTPGASQCIASSPESFWRILHSSPARAVPSRAGERKRQTRVSSELLSSGGVSLQSEARPDIAGSLASMREDATRLRQSSPFTNFLMFEERARIFEAFRWTREQLEHLLRASASVLIHSGSRSSPQELVVIGSQAILGQYPQAPGELLRSMEADLYPLR